LRLPVRLLVALAVVMGGGACGGDSEPEIPPLTAEPGDPQPGAASTATLSPAQSKAARTVLQRYLRALGSGDERACTYLAPDYETAVFGESGCRTELAQSRREMDEADLAALRTVRVPTGEPGPQQDQFTVRFADLEWSAGPAQPGGLLEPRFVLQKTGSRWRVSA
jgi:hypothetical protein